MRIRNPNSNRIASLFVSIARLLGVRASSVPMNLLRFALAIIVLGSVVLSVSGGETVRGTLTHDEQLRTFDVYLPDSYDGQKPWPLVLLMHGATIDGTFQESISRMKPAADANDFLVVYPNAINNRWNSGQQSDRPDDVEFIDQLLDHLAATYRVDKKRIYASGFSQGGAMSYLVGNGLPDRIAAIASVAGSPSVSDTAGNPRPFNPTVAPTSSRPVPLLHIMGTADDKQYNGGVLPTSDAIIPPVTDVVGAWAENNRCDPTTTVTAIPDTNPNDGPTTVELFVFENCATYTGAGGGTLTAEVSYYVVENGGHAWPGGRYIPSLGFTNYDMNASEEIWNFFNRHTLPQDATSEICDYNNDARCNQMDVDALTAAIVLDSHYDARLDSNGDLVIDANDLSNWLAIAAAENGYAEPYLLGDADLDGSVDASDLNRLALNWQGATNRWSDGDFNVDGMVSSVDLNGLALHWRESVPAADALPAVPEPSTGMLAVLGLLHLSRRYNRLGSFEK